MKQADTTHATEMRCFSRYLIGRVADQRACELYEKAMSQSPPTADARERRILAFALAHPWSIAPLDGALALTDAQALLRRKLLTATAVLETRPAYCDAFLPQERSNAHLLVIFLVLLRAVGRAMVGLALLRFLR
jgi:hypothetical protein